MAQEDQEFEESEIIFQDNINCYANQTDIVSNHYVKCNDKKRNKKQKSSSVPINIPVINVYKVNHDMLDEDWYDDQEERGGIVIPPHLIIRKRRAGTLMAFSLCTGNGRTLKGRDLREVRDSILRMTGFLET